MCYIQELLSHLTQAQLPKEKKRSIEIEIQGLLNESKKTSIKKEDKKNVIKLLGGSNKNIPSLSKFVKLKYSESMGRCLSVTTDVKPGKKWQIPNIARCLPTCYTFFF